MRIRSLLLALTALTLACTPAEAPTDEPPTMEAAGADAPECWRRDNPTEEQLAERPSPAAETSIRLGEGEDQLRVCYSQPQARGREVMGALVPFGEEWRTGANEATALHLTFPASVAGMEVEPGSYSIVTVPGEDEWEIILNSEWQRWGIGIPADAHIARATVPVEETEEMIEAFTIRLEPQEDGSAHMIMEWENTRVRVPIVPMD